MTKIEEDMIARWLEADFESGAYMGTLKTVEYLNFMLLVPVNTKFMHGDCDGRVYASVVKPVWDSYSEMYYMPNDGDLYEFICNVGSNGLPYPIKEV